MSKTRALVGLASAIALSFTIAAPAHAYPSGVKPALGLSSYTRLLPGDTLKAVLTHVQRGCTATIGWENATPVTTGAASRSGRTGSAVLNAPALAGTYNLVAKVANSCADSPGHMITKKITIGHVLRTTALIKTSTASAARNPKLTLSGTVFWGITPVANKAVTLSLSRPGATPVSLGATTDSSGKFSALVSTGVVAGNYTLTVSTAADTVNVASTKTSRTVTIRK